MNRNPIPAALLAVVWLVLGAAEPAPQPKTLTPSEAAQQGLALVTEILAQRPSANITNKGILKTRDAHGKRTKIPIQFELLVTPTNWQNLYHASWTPATNAAAVTQHLTIQHDGRSSDKYELRQITLDPASNLLSSSSNTTLTGSQIMTPFAGSDFWVADLGLAFLRWPDQRIVRTELRRSRSCRVLESFNPQPVPGTYSRVLSWLDVETDAVIQAEAYDLEGKLLKEFDPKKVKKINGQWQLEEMEISNVQTGSRTRIEFELDQK
jgi:hypothetical protein